MTDLEKISIRLECLKLAYSMSKNVTGAADSATVTLEAEKLFKFLQGKK